MKRFFLFTAVFVSVAVLIFGFIYLLNKDAFTTFLKNRKAMSEGSEWVEKTYSLQGLTEYIRENPGNVSLASRVISHPDSVFYYGETIQRPMGSLSFYFIIAGYLSAFENGTIDSQSQFEWDLTNRYILPQVDESIHYEAKADAVDKGWLAEGNISYRNALALLAEYNSFALADYLWFHLGADYWPAFMNNLSLENTDYPLPLSGLYLAAAPNIRGIPFGQIEENWQELSKEDQHSLVIGLSESFATDSSTRNEYLEKLNRNRLDITFTQERDALAMFPKTTALDMVQMLEELWEDRLISEWVSLEIKEILEWPMEKSEVRRNLSVYGAMYDNRMGLLNGIDFGTSAYTDDTTVQAVFFDRIPISFWFHMSSNHMHQDFQQRLIYDPALIELIDDITTEQNDKHE